MRRITIVILALSIFVSCSKVDENRLIGKWKLSRMLFDKDDLESRRGFGADEFDLKFSEDGTLLYEKYYTVTGEKKDSVTGTWALDEEEEMLTISIDGTLLFNSYGEYNIDIFNRRYLVFHGFYTQFNDTFPDAQWHIWKP